MPQLILVVDDDTNVVDLISLNLIEAGYEVMTAFTGRAALEKVAARRPDLILLDLMLPDIDGFGVCEILRSTETTATIPIVITSVWRSAGSRRLGKELGAFDYLAKPFRQDELIDRVRRTLAKPLASGAGNKGAKADAPVVAKRRKMPV
ncbi:MAG TPA: response regulator [Opitutaceae bacterium]|nr:response regulator [Opitutaceae bacterium]